MKSQPLTQVSLRINPEAEEVVSAAFERVLGQPSSVYQDVHTGIATASVYLSDTGTELTAKLTQLKALLNELKRDGVERGAGKLRTQRVRREDWAESWKRHFKPIDIAGRLLIKPSWSKRRPRRGQAVVVLDPGLSFGTGQHATTGSCLSQLVALRRAGEQQSFLDVGTGSGILAIAAAKLGYRPVLAFDSDPEAVRVAGENAAANQVAGFIQLRRQDVLRLRLQSRRQFAVICANLTYDLLLEALPPIVARLASGGVLVLAGILRAQFPQVRGAYERAGLKLTARLAEKEWMSGAFVRSA